MSIAGAGLALDLLNIGTSFGSARKDREMQSKHLGLAKSQFDTQMNESVRRRVADAKAAGVHPLFALGANVGASPTLTAGHAPTTSGNVNRAIGGAAQRLASMEAIKASTARDEAEANLLNSEAALMGQNLGSRGRDGVSSVKTFPYGTPTEEVAFGPGEFFNPPVATSKRVGTESGLHPRDKEYVRSDGTVGSLYAESLQADEVNQVRLVANEINHAIDSAELKPKRITDRRIKQLENELAYAKRYRKDKKFRDMSNQQRDFLNYWYGELRRKISEFRRKK